MGLSGQENHKGGGYFSFYWTSVLPAAGYVQEGDGYLIWIKDGSGVHRLWITSDTLFRLQAILIRKEHQSLEPELTPREKMFRSLSRDTGTTKAFGLEDLWQSNPLNPSVASSCSESPQPSFGVVGKSSPETEDK